MIKKAILIVVAVINLVFIDAVTKEYAFVKLKNSPAVSVVDGFFNLAYVENRGCAWGMLQGKTYLLAVFSLAVLIFLCIKRRSLFEGYKNKLPQKVSHVAEVLIYAGIVGNMIDRIFRGFVVDFFDFHWQNAYHFPCFNFADIYISLSAALLLLLSFSDHCDPKERN
jgi:signal peptidase II